MTRVLYFFIAVVLLVTTSGLASATELTGVVDSFDSGYRVLKVSGGTYQLSPIAKIHTNDGKTGARLLAPGALIQMNLDLNQESGKQEVIEIIILDNPHKTVKF